MVRNRTAVFCIADSTIDIEVDTILAIPKRKGCSFVFSSPSFVIFSMGFGSWWHWNGEPIDIEWASLYSSSVASKDVPVSASYVFRWLEATWMEIWTKKFTTPNNPNPANYIAAVMSRVDGEQTWWWVRALLTAGLGGWQHWWARASVRRCLSVLV